MSIKSVQRLSRSDFHVAIVTTLDIETQAIDKFIDERYDAAELRKLKGDQNHYTVGRIGRHNVVLVKLVGRGTRNSGPSASTLTLSYTDIHLVLLVGICAGVPFRNGTATSATETILGDVIISDSIVQIDDGKQHPHTYERRTGRRVELGMPNQDIRSILSSIQAGIQPFHEKMLNEVARIQKKDNGRWAYVGTSEDRLFKSSFQHKHYQTKDGDTPCECFQGNNTSCYSAMKENCEKTKCAGTLIRRTRLDLKPGYIPTPAIHIGTVGSANTVMRSGEHRDELVDRELKNGENIIALEMEGAGMWEGKPCVIIKGVADYADSHKNDRWHDYAAATAAACAAAFLSEWIPFDSDRVEHYPRSHYSKSPRSSITSQLNRVESSTEPEEESSKGSRTNRAPDIGSKSLIAALLTAHRKIFYTLTSEQKHLRPKVNGYWERLTLDSYHVYRQIFRNCRNPDTDKVSLSSLVQEFDNSDDLSHTTIRTYWDKVIPPSARQPNKKLPSLSEANILAILYMLHIYYTLGEEPEREFDAQTYARIARFADWALCKCPLKCGRAWNFTSNIGIWKRHSPPRDINDRCLVDEHQNLGIRNPGHRTAYNATFNDWSHWKPNRVGLFGIANPIAISIQSKSKPLE
ncbi:nucleoside phosphorylase domain-containing protein [Talaromyces proteolyticus]|uniref:Nucleoside phosphorylase domain-containing protein n=1 Tax=Talaromyces proteolyticus TaxID=1131652 RepID=A0AAD4KM65_9EURO|nr:nucleoside phosphorylase domain-containing protein [Talaromyces proteolyticus]KAH8695982.1 nucleoside phosphorylase domain-containing protein [Talaromyces proteolyticus]